MRRTSIPLLFGFLGLTAGCFVPAEAPTATSVTPRAPEPKAAPSHDADAPRSRAQSPLPAGASRISFARIAKYPEPGWHVPSQFSFRGGPQKLTFLASEKGDDTLALHQFDETTGASKVILRADDLLGKSDVPLSKEEELRRERQRQRSKGITSYSFAKRGGRLVVAQGGDVFVRDPDGRVRTLTKTPEPELDPKICATGQKVVFVRGSELYTVDVESGKETPLTRGAKAHVTRGQSDYNAQEEFGESSGYWISPDCKQVAFLEVDDSEVEEILVPGFRSGEPKHDGQRYPRPGKKNPSVKLFLTKLEGGTPRKIDLPDLPEHYFVQFTWEPGSAAFAFEALPRDQRTLRFVRVETSTGKHVTREIAHDSRYVDAEPMVAFDSRPGLVSLGLHEGHTHLEVRDPTGVLEKTLTHGAWDVVQIAGIDEKNREVYFVGTKDGPLERHLYAVSYAEPGEPRKLTREPGTHVPFVDAETGRYVDVHSARNRPPAVVLRGAAGQVLRDLTPPEDPEIASLGVRPLEAFVTHAKDGTLLHGQMLRPRDFDPKRLYPLVVMVYGGPGVQTVVDKFTPKLLWQHLADRGFFVAQIDNRGSAGRGFEFAAATYGKLGEVELEDQLAGLETLKGMPGVDPTRVGLYGTSYGGTMTLQGMLRAPGKYKAGVADASVVDWSLYDSGYTERYLGPLGPAYQSTELSRHAHALEGRLLVLHGLMDENVHFANSAKLVDALIGAQKPFDFFVFPGERHGTRDPAAKEWSSRKVTDFFAETLR